MIARRTTHLIAAGALLLAACLPLQQTSRNQDVVLRAYDVDGAPGASRIMVTTSSSNTDLTVVASSVASCSREHRQEVKRWHDVERHTPSRLHGALYAVGVLAMIAGGAVIYDNAANDNTTRTLAIGSNTKVGKEAGAGIAAAGTLLLGYAIGNSIHAEDSHDYVGQLELPVPGSRHVVECQHVPAKAQELALVFSTGCAQLVTIPLGATDAQGRVVTPWAAIIAKANACTSIDGDIVAGNVSVGKLTIPEDAAWAVAVAADTGDSYRAFASHFPTSGHAVDAAERGKAATVRDASKDLEAALAANQLDKADAALATLKTAADPAIASAAEARVAEAHKKTALDDARKRIPDLIAAIDAAADPLAAVTAAAAAIDVVRQADPDEATKDQAQLEDARKKTYDRLVHDGQAALAKEELAAGKKLFDQAAGIAPDPKALDKARTAAMTRAIRSAHDDARKLAYAGKYEDAIALLDKLTAYAPDDKTLAADKDRWTAAIARRAQEAEAKAKRDEERAIREAKTKEAREAAEQAARDRAAAAEAERQKRIAAQEAEKARIEQERKDREEQARQVAEAERARRKAEDEARRQAAEQLRLGEADRPRAASTALSMTVQLELPERAASEDVTKRIPVPQVCKVTSTSSFMAISPLCTQCEARPVTRMELSCGPHGSFSFTRDASHVWVTCSNTAGTTCGTCLAAAKMALGGALSPKDKLTVVKGCR